MVLTRPPHHTVNDLSRLEIRFPNSFNSIRCSFNLLILLHVGSRIAFRFRFLRGYETRSLLEKTIPTLPLFPALLSAPLAPSSLLSLSLLLKRSTSSTPLSEQGSRWFAVGSAHFRLARSIFLRWWSISLFSDRLDQFGVCRAKQLPDIDFHYISFIFFLMLLKFSPLLVLYFLL